MVTITCLLPAAISSSAAVHLTIPVHPIIAEPTPLTKDFYKKFSSLKISQVQKLLGRRLTLKEKISFLILKKKMRKANEDANANTGFAFGLAAVFTLVLGFFVPYVLVGALLFGIFAVVFGYLGKKENGSNKKSQSGYYYGLDKYWHVCVADIGCCGYSCILELVNPGSIL